MRPVDLTGGVLVRKTTVYSTEWRTHAYGDGYSTWLHIIFLTVQLCPPRAGKAKLYDEEAPGAFL